MSRVTSETGGRLHSAFRLGFLYLTATAAGEQQRIRLKTLKRNNMPAFPAVHVSIDGAGVKGAALRSFTGTILME
jgi:hypothetical protein